MSERLTNVTPEEQFEKNIVYHRDCYSETTNLEKLERAKKALLRFSRIWGFIRAKRKTGRLSISLFPNVQEETVTTRSMSSFFDKALYIICQCPGGVIDRVQFKAART